MMFLRRLNSHIMTTGAGLQTNQKPAPPDLGAVVGGVVTVGRAVVGVGALGVTVLPVDPHAAAPTPSIATQAITAMR